MKGKEITLDLANVLDTFDGLGVLSAGAGSRLLIDYEEPYRAQILDLLFKPNFGASMQHLKVEVGGDSNSTFGTEPSPMRTHDEYEKAYSVIVEKNNSPKLNTEVEVMFRRGYEYWLAAEAKRRNPDIILDCLQWAAPGWIGDGNINSQDNANFLSLFILGAKKYWNIDFDLVGGMQNEYNNYNAEYLKLLRKTLDGFGLNNIKISVCDFNHKESYMNFAKLLENDPELLKIVYAYGIHYPAALGNPPEDFLGTCKYLREHGVKIWCGEDASGGMYEPKEAYFDIGLQNARFLNNNYITYRQTMTQHCFPVLGWIRALDELSHSFGFVNVMKPWAGHYKMSPNGWAFAHTTQFTKVGWQYLSAESGACGTLDGDGNYVTLVDPQTGDYSIVIQTRGAEKEQLLTFNLRGGMKTDSINVWESYGKDDSTWFIRKNKSLINRVSVAGDSFTITLKPNSMVTITSTDKGFKGSYDNIPEPAWFPSEYKDDFNSYSPSTTAKYLSDLFGVFEIVTDEDPAHGQCIEQQITTKPIRWFFEDYLKYRPTMVIGEYDYTGCILSIDVKMPVDVADDEYIEIGGFNSAGFNWPDFKTNYGTSLRIFKNGKWELYGFTLNKLEKPLPLALEGVLPGFDGSVWHTYKIESTKEKAIAYADGIELGSTPESRGIVGIYLDSGWNRTRFDNLYMKMLSK